MATLTSRIYIKQSDRIDPEDYLWDSLGVIFPDDVTVLHGDADHPVTYASPHLSKPIELDLCDPTGEDRTLFSHHLWNASLLAAEFVEADTLGLEMKRNELHEKGLFDVKGLSTMEFGAGTALPSIMSSILGAESVTVTDYPSDVLLKTLRKNVERNVQAFNGCEATVHGHEWGNVTDEFSIQHRGRYDRLFVCDCLWMPWQHANLRVSIAHFLKHDDEARCWVFSGFHTGREKMNRFFDQEELQNAGLVVDKIWERDCNGVERQWDPTPKDDVGGRKRWLSICILKRL